MNTQDAKHILVLIEQTTFLLIVMIATGNNTTTPMQWHIIITTPTPEKHDGLNRMVYILTEDRKNLKKIVEIKKNKLFI